MQRSPLIFTFAAALYCVATDSAFGQAGVTNELPKLIVGEQVSAAAMEPVTGSECIFDYECFPRPNVCYTPICCTQPRVDDGQCAADEIGTCTAIYRRYGDIDENGVGPKVFDIFCVLDIIAGDETRCTFEQTDIVGSAGSPCTPNGVVNIFEAFACLEAIEGTDPCCSGAACCTGELLDTCSYEWPWTCIDDDGLYLPDVKSCTPDPCGGPAPLAARPLEPALRSTRHSAAPVEIKLVPSTRTVQPGDTADVHVFATGAVRVRGYEVKAAITGGRRGSLELVSASIRDRRDNLIKSVLRYSAVNHTSGRIVAVTPDPSAAAAGTAYLGTFTLRATGEAYGTFQVGLDADPDYLVVADAYGALYPVNVTPAAIRAVAPRCR